MFAAFLGPPRSGKTSLATALLTQEYPKLYNGVFHHVYIFMPQASFQSMASPHPFADHNKKKIFHELTEATLQSVVSAIEASTKKGEQSLVLIDDFMSSLKDTTLRKGLERLICNRRHLRTSVWIISQNFNAIPLSTRRLLSNVFLFRSANNKEVDAVRDELIPIEKAHFTSIYNHVFPPGGDPHAFLYIDIATGELFNKFSKIMFA